MKNTHTDPNKTHRAHKNNQPTNRNSPASSSDSDSSDEDVPVARKPAGATMGAGASKSMTPATKGVVSATGGGKGLSAAVASSKRPAVSSSDSDTRVEDIPAVKNDTRRVGESSDVVFGSQNGSCGKRSFMTSGLPSDAKRHKLDVSDMVDVDSGRRSLPAVSDTWNGVNSSEKRGSLSGHKSRQSFPFRRVPDDIELIDPQLSNNSYEAKPNSRGAWGERAYKDFQFTSGKSFKHEKTKKKRGNYAGGTLSTAVSSYKFDD
ncbi:nucleolar and coiled-body phosphoprotein 1 [Clonorchis sinensis]|uniref:Nucleolar and coiled-body phosphoprotein 1 n=1 Tax=Clonorchis sinensis TaxID=79923 RepID=A0A8T1MDR6_CLOSI|nr:nucleolar and coiled-body phosphoprotein 1 [Clonorchis sinensis]